MIIRVSWTRIKCILRECSKFKEGVSIPMTLVFAASASFPIYPFDNCVFYYFGLFLLLDFKFSRCISITLGQEAILQPSILISMSTNWGSNKYLTVKTKSAKWPFPLALPVKMRIIAVRYYWLALFVMSIWWMSLYLHE